MFDDAFLSHAVLWFFAGISALTAIGLAVALFAMGRSGYRKD